MREFGRAETIAERKARLAYDREHPWAPINDAVSDGTVYALQFWDVMGNFDGGEHRFILIPRPKWRCLAWVCITRKQMPFGRPCGFRPTGKTLSKTEIAKFKHRAGVSHGCL